MSNRSLPAQLVWLDTPDVSKRIGVPEGTLKQWRHRGIGPTSYRIGRNTRYLQHEVDAWLEQQLAKTARGDGAA